MGKFKFQGINVIQDLEFRQAVSATIKGDLIEITKTDGAIETIPKTDINIGQLVGYCCVLEKYSNDELEVVEFEIDESKNHEEKRNAWRKDNGLDMKNLTNLKTFT